MLLLSSLSYHPQPCSGPWLLPMLHCLPIPCIRCPLPAFSCSPCLSGSPLSLHFLSGRGCTGPRSEEGDEGNSLQSCYIWKCFWEWNKDTTTVDEDVRIYSDAANRSAADEIFQEGNMAKNVKDFKSMQFSWSSSSTPKNGKSDHRRVFFLVLFKLLKY